MNLKNKKGFTIVELVIVIAVIAILAAILIPTFSNIVETANNTAAQAELKNAYSAYTAELAMKGEAFDASVHYFKIDNAYYIYSNTSGQFTKIADPSDKIVMYEDTPDTALVEGKNYYTLAESTYSLVGNPAVDDIATYYQLVVRNGVQIFSK